METIYFTFGVLSVIAVIIIMVIVYGIVKVYKQQSEITNLWRAIEDGQRQIREEAHWSQNELNGRFRDIYEQIERSFDNAKGTANAYTDSRVDKLEAKLTGTSEVQVQLNNKSLLKG